MWRTMASTGLLFAAVVGFGLTGCSSQPRDSRSDAPADQTTSGKVDHTQLSHDEHAGPGDGEQSAMDKMKAELAKLSPVDAASAEQQHVCPVSGEMLGTMGAPKKIDVDGRIVWICCDGCKDELLANPEKYFAKLKNE